MEKGSHKSAPSLLKSCKGPGWHTSFSPRIVVTVPHSRQERLHSIMKALRDQEVNRPQCPEVVCECTLVYRPLRMSQERH